MDLGYMGISLRWGVTPVGRGTKGKVVSPWQSDQKMKLPEMTEWPVGSHPKGRGILDGSHYWEMGNRGGI